MKNIHLQEYVMLVTQGYSNALWESRAMEILSLFFNTFNSMAALSAITGAVLLKSFDCISFLFKKNFFETGSHYLTQAKSAVATQGPIPLLIDWFGSFNLLVFPSPLPGGSPYWCQT